MEGTIEEVREYHRVRVKGLELSRDAAKQAFSAHRAAECQRADTEPVETCLFCERIVRQLADIRGRMAELEIIGKVLAGGLSAIGG